MESIPTTSIKWLREQLVRARREKNLAALEQVEEGLRALGECGYRCCLLDYERGEVACYVRLLGYEQGRVKAELEYPIRPGLSQVQLLPLSHLADYAEAGSREEIHRIHTAIAPFIHHKTAPLARSARRAPVQEQFPEYEELALPAAAGFWSRSRIGWCAAGGLVLVGIFLLIVYSWYSWYSGGGS